jgi:protein gp37
MTKRAERMTVLLGKYNIPPDVWLGATVENKRHDLPRIDWLRKVDARVRFLSM